MLTLQEEIQQAIKFFGVMDLKTLQFKLSMRRAPWGTVTLGDYRQVPRKDIRDALKEMVERKILRKATGVEEGWTLR